MKRFKDRIHQIVKHRIPLILEQLIGQVNPIIRDNSFAAVGYPRPVFFKLDWLVWARCYRWSRRLRCLMKGDNSAVGGKTSRAESTGASG